MSKYFIAAFAFVVVFMTAFASATNACPWDVNLDETVDNLDRSFVRSHFNCEVGSSEECSRADVDKNGFVNAGDAGHILVNMGMICPLAETVSDNRPREDSTPTMQVQCRADVDKNGIVEMLDRDFVSMRIEEGCTVGTGNSQCDVADVDANGFVNPGDLGFISVELGRVCGTEAEETDGGRSAENTQVVEVVEETPIAPVVVESAPIVEAKKERRKSTNAERTENKNVVLKEKVSEKQNNVVVKETQNSIKLESKAVTQKTFFSKLMSFFKRN